MKKSFAVLLSCVLLVSTVAAVITTRSPLANAAVTYALDNNVIIAAINNATAFLKNSINGAVSTILNAITVAQNNINSNTTSAVNDLNSDISNDIDMAVSGLKSHYLLVHKNVTVPSDSTVTLNVLARAIHAVLP